MRFSDLVFHQAMPPGPVRGSLETFLILAIFNRVDQILKLFPTAFGTPGVATETMKSGNFVKHESNAYVWSIIDLYSFLIGCCFKFCGNGLKFENK